MAVQYLKIPTSSKKLADEATRLIEMYQTSAVSDDEMKEIMIAWNRTVPSLLYQDGKSGEVNRSIVRYIGKKRTMVLNTFLSEIGN